MREFTMQRFLILALLAPLPSPDVIACKPCPDPTLPNMLNKADVVLVAEVVKVDVTSRKPTPPGRELRDVRWQVKVARGLKGGTPREITVEHADTPPCISAVVPQPGRYLMLLYHRDNRYIPLNYCDHALFAIDAQDRVTLTPAMARDLRLPSEQVPLKNVADLVDVLMTPPPT